MSGLFTPEIREDTAAQSRVRELIAALRSGKYEQGQQYLRTDGKYCCLGVACDLYNSQIWEPSIDGHYGYLEHGASLPNSVQNSYHFTDGDGSYEDSDGPEALVSDNDHGVPFTEIADTIEHELELALNE